MNKYTKTISRFLIIFATVSFGSMLNTFYLNQSDDWKFYLSVIIGCLTLERFINRE